MRQHDHLRHSLLQSAHLSDSGKRSMLVETRHWIVDNDNLLRDRGILLDRREEEGEGKRVAIARAQRRAKGWSLRRRERDADIVDDDGIGAARSAARVHRANGIEPEAGVEPAEIFVDRSLIEREDVAPVVIEGVARPLACFLGPAD